AELRATGIVATAPVATSGSAGRPARRFRFAPAAATVAALDIGARTVRCIVADAAGRELTRTEAPMHGPDPIAPLMQAVRDTDHTPSAVGGAGPRIIHPSGRGVRSLAVPAPAGLGPAVARDPP